MDREKSGTRSPCVRDVLQRGEDEITSASLRELSERLQQAMRPVEPSAVFVRSLGRELVEASRRQRETARRLRRNLLIGAAALGSVASVAGVAFLLLRRRALKASEA